MDIAHNCMSLLVFWMPSDTAMKYYARSSCPSFARTTLFSSTKMPDLTSPLSAESFWMVKRPYAWLASIFPGFIPNKICLRRLWSGSSTPTSTFASDDQLRIALREEWENTPQVTIYDLVMSIGWDVRRHVNHTGYCLRDLDVATPTALWPVIWQSHWINLSFLNWNGQQNR